MSHSPQQQMEDALRGSAEQVAAQFFGTINSWLAPRFESCDAAAATYTCSFAMRREYANPSGVVLHGGLTAVLFDTAMGHLAHFYSGCMTPTISMNLSYLRSVPVDRPIFIRSHMDKPGSTVHYLSAEAFTADAPDKILATATGVYLAKTNLVI